MKLIHTMRSLGGGLALRSGQPRVVRTIATYPSSGNGAGINNSTNSSESTDEFERRIFSGFSDNSPSTDSFYRKLDKIEQSRGRSGFGGKMDGGNNPQFSDVLDESFNTLSDGMDGKLKKAATYFEFNPDEIRNDDYAFRPDVTYKPGMQYEPKDLDLTKPGIRKPFERPKFEVTTEEVLRKADFRNVRFLANFITEAGIIIKRSSTKISAKAQRKVAREIKTARAFGLMPFTTMGQDKFEYGRSREELDEDDEYDNYYSRRGGYDAPRRNFN